MPGGGTGVTLVTRTTSSQYPDRALVSLVREIRLGQRI
jgi:hypothetical protein